MRAYTHSDGLGVKATTALIVGLAACSARPSSVAPAGDVPRAGDAGLTVSLVWSAPVDLDLYVTDPSLETVYFASPRTRSGGMLVRDTRCADGGGPPHLEVVRWKHPPPGRYRVGVDFMETCTPGSIEVSYRVAVDTGGQRRETLGHVRLGERDPLVLEFTVAKPRAGEGAR